MSSLFDLVFQFIAPAVDGVVLALEKFASQRHRGPRSEAFCESLEEMHA
jgi:hypothetical protein